jgi:hypothetical protein
MSASSDVQNKVIVSAVRAHEYLVAQDPSFEQKKLDSTFRMAVKPYRNMADQLNDRITIIGENFNEASEDYKSVHRNYCKATCAAVALTIAEMSASQAPTPALY